MDHETWIVILLAVIAVLITWDAVEHRKMQDELNRVYTAQLAIQGMLHARQSKIAYDRTFQQAPGVDARARTSHPDRPDIPVRGGTQRPLKFKRVGGDIEQEEIE